MSTSQNAELAHMNTRINIQNAMLEYINARINAQDSILASLNYRIDLQDMRLTENQRMIEDSIRRTEEYLMCAEGQ